MIPRHRPPFGPGSIVLQMLGFSRIMPGYLPRTNYPNAGVLGSEILNLPLDPSLALNEVDRVCDCLITSVAGCEGQVDPSLSPRRSRVVS